MYCYAVVQLPKSSVIKYPNAVMPHRCCHSIFSLYFAKVRKIFGLWLTNCEDHFIKVLNNIQWRPICCVQFVYSTAVLTVMCSFESCYLSGILIQDSPEYIFGTITKFWIKKKLILFARWGCSEKSVGLSMCGDIPHYIASLCKQTQSKVLEWKLI